MSLLAMLFMVLVLILAVPHTSSGLIRGLFWDLAANLHLVKPAGSGRDLVSRTSLRVSAIALACHWYESEYGHLPFTGERDEQVQNCSLLLDILLARTDKDNVGVRNPNGIVFGDPSLEATKPTDPWGNALKVVFAVDGGKYSKVCGKEVGDSVAIWSAGPNGKDECGRGDDIRSWK
jgi:hypothetical protein